MKQLSIFTMVLVLASVAWGCVGANTSSADFRSGEQVQTESVPLVMSQKKDGNFTLYLGNMSFKLSPIDVVVRIDGQVAVNQDFPVHEGRYWKKFQYELSDGAHVIEVTSKKGKAAVTRDFEMDGKAYGQFAYFQDRVGQSGSGPDVGRFSAAIKNTDLYFKPGETVVPGDS